MDALVGLVRTKVTAVWVVLTCATLMNWALRTEHGVSSQRLTSMIVMVVALVKVRLVGLYFMELRRAPSSLRRGFESYCVAVLIATIAMYVVRT